MKVFIGVIVLYILIGFISGVFVYKHPWPAIVLPTGSVYYEAEQNQASAVAGLIWPIYWTWRITWAAIP